MKRGYMYIQSWFTLWYSRNNIVKQLYSKEEKKKSTIKKERNQACLQRKQASEEEKTQAGQNKIESCPDAYRCPSVLNIHQTD